jgi:YbbR domain-containing protein
MNLITDDWRLKLLALALGIVMLGAVAFSQNPPTQVTLRDVPIGYTVNSDIIVINPPTKTTVTVKGLADTLTTITANSVAASFDLSKATPGPNFHASLVVRSLISGVSVQSPIVPYTLNIDRLTLVAVPVTVRTQRVTTGWFVTSKVASCPQAPCSVTFTGPSTWETNLAAFADVTAPIEQNTYDLPNQPVLLVQNGQALDLTVRTEPPVSIDPLSVSIHIEAKTGTTSRQVVLVDAPPSNGPPAGYRVTNVTINPITVVLSGAPEALAKVTIITLPPVDLSGKTSTAIFKINIPYPEGVTGSNAVATVTYTIAPNPNVTPSP